MAMRYSAPAIVARVMLLAVGVPLAAGAAGAAWSPLATAPAAAVPVGVMAAVAPATLACGMLAGSVMGAAAVLAAVGVPVIGTVTTVSLVLAAVPAARPAGRPDTAKLAGVMVAAYAPLESVYTMLPVTACPTFKLPSPVDVMAMAGVPTTGLDVVIVALGGLAGEAL